MIANQYESRPVEEFSPHIEEILQFGVCKIDSKTSTVNWSRGLYILLGFEPFSVEPGLENLMKHVHAADSPLVAKALDEATQFQKAYKIGFSITDPKGSQKRLMAENYFQYDANHMVAGQTIVIKNVSENHLQLQQLEHKIEDLKKSNNNLQEFVHVASHDLKEPLRKIAVFTEKLNSEYYHTLPEGAKVSLNKISGSARSMQILLDDLLSFSTLSANEKGYEKVSVNSLIKSVLSDLEIKIEKSECNLDCSDIPLIDGYPSQIKQLFSNLITNSIKFRKEGSTPVIKISCEEVNPGHYPQLPILLYKPYIKIIISDNGMGFEQIYSEKIFQVFQRLHSKAEYDGSGIGLSICKKIMDNHRGYIFANGQPGIGATFTLLFPKTQY